MLEVKIMKKILFCILIIFSYTGLFAQQQPVVAVAPFDAISGINAAEANMISRAFNIRLGNTHKVVLVDRDIVERIIQEHHFQAGDWSNQQKTAELGRALNANWIVRGNFERFGNNVLFTVSFYDIATFQFRGGDEVRVANADAAYDHIPKMVDNLITVIERAGSVPIVNNPSRSSSSSNTGIAIEVSTKEGGVLYFQGNEVATLWDNDTHTIPIDRQGTYTLKMIFVGGREETKAITISSRGITKVEFLATRSYTIGETGPAGGIVFYDKGSYSNGWRFLEAAPANTEFNARWGTIGHNVAGTETAIGSGRRNTQIIGEHLNRSGESGRAAQRSSQLNINGFSDWFLPSKDEVNLMYINLKQKGWGSFGLGSLENKTFYISSSQSGSNSMWLHDFNNGRVYGTDGGNTKDATYVVRAIRAF